MGNPQWKSSNNLPYPLSRGELFTQLVDTRLRQLRGRREVYPESNGQEVGAYLPLSCVVFLAGCEKATLFLSVQEDHRAPLYQTAHGEKLGEEWTED